MTIEQLLTDLKMKGSLEALSSLKEIQDRDQFTTELLRAELKEKEIRGIKRRLAQAKFPTDKEWTDIDPTLNPKIDFSKIKQFGESEFIAQRRNLCLMGQQGTGKTHSLVALGRQLCKRGISVRFYTACSLVTALEEAKANHCLSKTMQSLLKPQLLLIDELGFIPFSDKGARLLFDVFASRYEKGSIALSTNLLFNKWTEIFGSTELTGALLDRFSHKCFIFNHIGDSVRLMQAKKQSFSLKL